MRSISAATKERDGLGTNVVRVLALAVLFAAGAVLEILKLTAVHDPEIWRHLRIGSWILTNWAWPHTGLFSQSASLPWRDFSWGYDVLAATAYRILGLRAVPALLISFRIVLAIVTFVLAGGRRRLWSAIAFSIAAQYVLWSLGPTSEFCSVVLFGAELILIQEIRMSGNVRPMYLLPALFVLWANLDIGFVYGVAAYLLFLLTLWIEVYGNTAGWNFVQKTQAEIPIKTAALSGFACVAASLVNPYGYRVYPAFS